MAEAGRLEIAEITSPEDTKAAFAIRHEVFCVEQEVDVEEEFDGLDDTCRHYLAHLDGTPVGAARIRILNADETKIERVAVLKDKRGYGVGQALMTRTIDDVERSGVKRIIVNAQTHAETFYAALGFVAEGGVFDEAGIPHVRMVRVCRESL